MYPLAQKYAIGCLRIERSGRAEYAEMNALMRNDAAAKRFTCFSLPTTRPAHLRETQPDPSGDDAVGKAISDGSTGSVSPWWAQATNRTEVPENYSPGALFFTLTYAIKSSSRLLVPSLAAALNSSTPTVEGDKPKV